MQKKKALAVIRDRGQITIPDEVRKNYEWIGTSEVITFDTSREDEVTIRPLTPFFKKEVTKKVSEKDWEQIFSDMKKIRSQGEKNVDLAKFIREDRESHF